MNVDWINASVLIYAELFCCGAVQKEGSGLSINVRYL